MTVRWWELAECAGWDGFYNMPIDAQKEVCADCPVRNECLTDAVKAEEQRLSFVDDGWPVYGGLSGRERQQLIRKQRHNPAPHGSYPRYRKHVKDGERGCDDCQEAARKEWRKRDHAKRATS